MNELFNVLVAQTSAMKLSAPRIRAGGPEGPFEAAVLLREATRIDARAMAALAPLDGFSRLRASVEHCGTLVDAGDATGVVRNAWPAVLERVEEVGDAAAAPYLQRLRPAVDALQRDLDALARQSRWLSRISAVLTGQVRANAPALLKELKAYLRRFPGDSVAWLQRTVVERVVAKDTPAAWVSVNHLLRLEPDLEEARLLRISMGIELLAPDELRALLRPALDELRANRGTPGLAIATAGGFIHLGNDARTRAEDLASAELAARCGLSLRIRQPWERTFLSAALVFVDDVRAGRDPRPEVYRRFGMPELAGRGDPVATLSRPPVDLPPLALAG